ncbi:MAG: 4Fe-4S dicluster domain-containing protein [Thermodesulfobacteriota bacterium]
MGHMVGKDVYQELGKKINNLTLRAGWNEKFYNMIKALYSEEEADVVVKMPYGFSNLARVAKVTKYEPTRLRKVIESLCEKGLVMDAWVNNDYYYMPSPIVIGLFEFTMMRTGDNLPSKEWAKLFHDYLMEGSFYRMNWRHGEKTSVERTLPYEEAVADHVEILDYEKASAIIEANDRFAIGLCSCRHEKTHMGEKTCETPLDTCSMFGDISDTMVRNKFAKPVSKSEMLDNLARSKDLGLVINADNVKNTAGFMCHCCGCCCNLLLGITKFGYPNTLVTSTFIAEIEEETCSGCGKCAKACHINAIEMVPIDNPQTKKKKSPKIDKSICLGCGVCAMKCKPKSLKLVKREQRVIHPETTFERVILQSLERGNLQYQIFDNPQSMTQDVMRGILGGFLRIPATKKALMSDLLRSRFLTFMKAGIKIQGRGWLTELYTHPQDKD